MVGSGFSDSEEQGTLTITKDYKVAKAPNQRMHPAGMGCRGLP